MFDDSPTDLKKWALNQRLARSLESLRRFTLPASSGGALEKGLRWKPTWKATPNDDRQLDRKEVPNILY